MTPSAAVGPPSRLAFIAVATVVPVLLLALIAWLTYEYQVAAGLRGAIRETADREMMASALLSSIRDAESSQRGYVITGDPDDLPAYDAAARRVKATSRRLDVALAADPTRGAARDALRTLIGLRLSQMDSAIRLRTSPERGAAATILLEREGEPAMARTEAIAKDMIRFERRRIAEAEGAYEDRSTRVRAIVWGLVAAISAIVAFLAAAQWKTRSDHFRTHRHLRGQAEWNRIFLDNAFDAIVILTVDGIIETINPAAAAMVGLSPEEVARRDISEILRLPDPDLPFRDRIGLIDGRLSEVFLPNYRVRHRDGHHVPADISLWVANLPEGDRIICFAHDISERLLREREKSEFISTINHELRTPLTSVIGSLGLLRTGAAGTLPDEATRLVEIADNNARRLIRLINDLLEIDRIESGRLGIVRVPIDLRDVASRACEGGEGQAAAGGIWVECVLPEGPVAVSGDADRLLQVATNLLSNAIRASAPGDTVTIGVSILEGRAVLTVDDNGCGLPAAFRDRIFRRFERAEGGREGGSGLGLAISRGIVARHDGSIWFEDRAGGGTRFAFALAHEFAALPEVDPA